MSDAAPKSVWWKRLGPTGLLALLWTAAPAIAGIVLLTYIGPVKDWFHAYPDAGLAIYTAIFILAGGFGLLPTYAQAVLGGWVFGMMYGLPAALIGFTGAALIGYVIARLVSHDDVERTINEHPRARVIRNALIGRGPWRTLGIVILLRLPPNSPFSLTNLAMASTGVGIMPFAIGTMFGMLPRTAVAVFFAATASAEGHRDIQGFVREGPGWAVFVGGLIVMFLVLGVIGSIANRALERLEGRTEDDPSAESAAD